MTKAERAQRAEIIADLADYFDRSGAAYTCAASVSREVRPLAVNLCRGTIHRVETMLMRAADEVHRRWLANR